MNNSIQKYLLYPFAVLYGFAVYIRNVFFDKGILKSHKFDVPVISVGNITVGGTGKTPHVEYLVNLLQNNSDVAVLSRGYKRKTKGFILADENSTADEIGDEPLQIKSKFPDITVAVDADRVNGIRKIMESATKTDLIILDDAFQHRYVASGLSILLIDFNRPIHKDLLMPSGRLREPAASAKRADIIVISKVPESISEDDRVKLISALGLKDFKHIYFTKVVAGNPVSVFNPESILFPANVPENNMILLVTGIANPIGVKSFAKNFSASIMDLIFPDHHAYSIADIKKILSEYNKMDSSEKYIFTTEKDATRLRKFENELDSVKDSIFHIPIAIEFLNDEELFNNQITTYVKSNKRNSILHSRKDRLPG